jgi:hypothetical protein
MEMKVDGEGGDVWASILHKQLAHSLPVLVVLILDSGIIKIGTLPLLGRGRLCLLVFQRPDSGWSSPGRDGNE